MLRDVKGGGWVGSGCEGDPKGAAKRGEHVESAATANNRPKKWMASIERTKARARGPEQTERWMWTLFWRLIFAHKLRPFFFFFCMHELTRVVLDLLQ